MLSRCYDSKDEDDPENVTVPVEIQDTIRAFETD
jgi:hypothetical protein